MYKCGLVQGKLCYAGWSWVNCTGCAPYVYCQTVVGRWKLVWRCSQSVASPPFPGSKTQEITWKGTQDLVSVTPKVLTLWENHDFCVCQAFGQCNVVALPNVCSGQIVLASSQVPEEARNVAESVPTNLFSFVHTLCPQISALWHLHTSFFSPPHIV